MAQPVLFQNSNMPDLETARLRLTPLHTLDEACLQTLMNQDPAFCETFSLHNYYQDRDYGAKRFLHDMVVVGHARGDVLYIAVRLKEQPEKVIGVISFDLFQSAERTWHRCCWLQAGFRKQGYMREASVAVTRWVFQHKDVKSLVCIINEKNVDSLRHASWQGFAYHLVLPESLPIWSITAEEFLERHAA